MLSILRASDDKTVEEERITETKTPDIVNLEILMAILNILCQCSSEIIYLKEMQKETELIKSSIGTYTDNYIIYVINTHTHTQIF